MAGNPLRGVFHRDSSRTCSFRTFFTAGLIRTGILDSVLQVSQVQPMTRWTKLDEALYRASTCAMLAAPLMDPAGLAFANRASILDAWKNAGRPAITAKAPASRPTPRAACADICPCLPK